MAKQINKEAKGAEAVKPVGLAFTRMNYIIMLSGVGLLMIGYLLMTGGGTDNLNEFHPEELFSTRRITVAPIVLLIGFVVVLYGIMHKGRAKAE
jgi:hypothetical protein